MIINILLLIFFSLVPLLLWGYGVTYLSDEEWNRRRFFFGMILGGLSVLSITLLHVWFWGSSASRYITYASLLGLILIPMWILTRYGSVYMRIFLRKTVLLHSGLFLLLALMMFAVSSFFPLAFPVFSLVLNLSFLIFSAFLEESVKHISTLGLSAHNFRFSRSDFLIFALFVTLGFVFLENLIYLIKNIHLGHQEFFLLGWSRSLFSLLAHVFAASICVVWWWKALSYRVFSLAYFGFFTVGFLGATLAHTIFNTLVAMSSFWGLLVFSVGAYIFVTRWLIADSPKVKQS